MQSEYLQKVLPKVVGSLPDAGLNETVAERLKEFLARNTTTSTTPEPTTTTTTPEPTTTSTTPDPTTTSTPAARDPSFQISVKRGDNEEMTMTVQSSHTIQKVKREIQGQSGISPDKQCLIFASKELEDGRTLASYNVGSEAKLCLAVEGVLKIPVRGLHGKINIVEQMFSDTIEDVKSKIRAELSIEDHQRLTFKGRGTLLARPDRPLRWFVDMSSNFKISVIEGSRRSTAEMESSNTIDEVMSKIHHKFNIPEDQQRILFAFLRVKHGRARRARCQQQQPLQQRQQQPSKRRRKSPGQGAKVDARPENAAPKATDIVCACTRRRHARASGATLVGRKQSSSPDRKKQKTVQRPSGSHCTGQCKTDAPCDCLRRRGRQ